MKDGQWKEIQTEAWMGVQVFLPPALKVKYSL